MAASFQNRDIISDHGFSREEILHLWRRKEDYELSGTAKRNVLRDALKYRSLAYMFYEPSTRTATASTPPCGSWAAGTTASPARKAPP